MSKEIKTQNAQDLQSTETPPAELMRLAIEKGADIGYMERLMDLQERWENKVAQKHYVNAMADFQSQCPLIEKKKVGHNCKYAPFEDIIAQVGDLLADCGFTYHFDQKTGNNGEIHIACIATHVDGHSERLSMSAPADHSGSKNAIQGIGSTTTYLRRYTFTGIFGIVTADEDLDGRLPEGYLTTTPEIDETASKVSQVKQQLNAKKTATEIENEGMIMTAKDCAIVKGKITKAKTLLELDDLRGECVPFNGTEFYDEVLTHWKARKQKLSTENPME